MFDQYYFKRYSISGSNEKQKKKIKPHSLSTLQIAMHDCFTAKIGRYLCVLEILVTMDRIIALLAHYITAHFLILQSCLTQ